MAQQPPPAAGLQQIERYGAGGFRVSGVVYAGPVLIFPDRTIAWEAPSISLDGLAPIVARGGIELVLIGRGRRSAPVDAVLRIALKTHGIGVEAMDTGAACRTYNLLLAEGRLVAAALLPLI